jgi:hypothetical protein
MSSMREAKVLTQIESAIIIQIRGADLTGKIMRNILRVPAKRSRRIIEASTVAATGIEVCKKGGRFQTMQTRRDG